MHKEIGSNFWLDRNVELDDTELTLDYLNLDFIDTAFLSTGRSAISFVLEHLKLADDKKVVLLPPFTCHSVIEPFISVGYRVHYFRINQDLSCNKDTFLEDVQEYNPSVVLVHGYFGFDILKPIKDAIRIIRESNIIVIEDITQTIYSSFEHTDADYYVSSFRKWTALPDGGCAISTKDLFSSKPAEVDERLQETKLSAFHAKYLYMTQDIGIKEDFFKKMHDAEQILSSQDSIYAMSTISRRLQGSLDIAFLQSSRRNNFSFLLRGLMNSGIVEPIFKNLPADVTPLYFPVYVRCNRRELQNFLAKRDIYAPIVWPKPTQCEGVINEEADWVYNHILAIPCDQRYNIDDMKRIIQSIEEYKADLLVERGAK